MKQDVKTGVYFCKHVNGHPDSLNLDELASFARDMAEVAKVWAPSDMDVADPGLLASAIKDNQVTRIILAGDRTGFIKSVFSRAMVLAGNDPQDVVVASFRDHNATAA